MIKMYLKEYKSWYQTYLGLIILYLLVFLLYHLPIYRFIIASLMSLTILLIFSFWKYLKFKEKVNILQEFIYVNELHPLRLPSELVYRELIEQLLEQHSDELLNEKKQQQNMEAIIKLWTHQMKIPLAALSFMGQTGKIEPLEFQKQTYNLQTQIDQLLSYLKFSQNNDDFRFEEVDVKQIVKDILKEMRFLCISKNLTIQLTGDWILTTDSKWLSFALSQVINNAVKYSERDGSIKIILSNNSVLIQDKGIGILNEDIPRLFEEGFTGFNGHEHRKATGLGLFMTKEVLNKLSLDITISSQVGQGTDVLISKGKR